MGKDERISELAQVMAASMRAYRDGVRIDDSMTYAEARLLNLGRKLAEGLARARPLREGGNDGR